MKKVINILVMLFIVSCSVINNNYLLKNETFWIKWKEDKKACHKFRYQNHMFVVENKIQFYSMKPKQINVLLGKPDKIASNGDWIYFVESGMQCIDDSIIADTKRISVHFNNNSVADIYIILP